MIYVGVKLFRNGFKIVALSEGFATIGKRYFTIGQFDKLNPWLNSLKLHSDEQARWFFDELEFNHPKYPGMAFQLLNDDNTIYLVNHRKLINVVQFFHEYLVWLQARPIKKEIAFFLASATRIFDEENLKPYYPDEEPF